MTQPKKTEKHLPATPKTTAPPSEGNEGEGSRSAARRYDAGAEQAAKDPKRVAELAKKPKEALDGPEGPALREAEERGKKGATRA